MEASHFGAHVPPFPSTACWLMIVREGVDKQSVTDVCINHLLTDSFSGSGSFHLHQKTKKKLLIAWQKPGKPPFFFECWGDSYLCNEKFSTRRRGWTFSPPLPGFTGAKQAQLAAEEKCCFLKLWVMWSYVCITLTQTQTFGFERAHVTPQQAHACSLYRLKWSRFVLQGFATVQAKSVLTPLSKYFFLVPIMLQVPEHTHARTR